MNLIDFAATNTVVDDEGNLLTSTVITILIVSALYFIYILLTFIIDRMTDYQKTKFNPQHCSDGIGTASFLISTYKIWELRKLAYLKKQYQVGKPFIWQETAFIIQNSSINEPVTIKVFRRQLPVKQPFTKAFIIQTDGYESANE